MDSLSILEYQKEAANTAIKLTKDKEEIKTLQEIVDFINYETQYLISRFKN